MLKIYLETIYKRIFVELICTFHDRSRFKPYISRQAKVIYIKYDYLA